MDRYTATVGGFMFRQVTCEDCGAEFVYRLERTGKSAGESLYFVDTRRIAGETDIVPCPECGWLQPSMVRAARRARFGWLEKIGWALLLFSVIFGVLNAVSQVGGEDPLLLDWDSPWVWIVVLGPSLLLLRVWLCARYDPNVTDRDALKKIGRAIAMRKEEFDQRVKEAGDAEKDRQSE